MKDKYDEEAYMNKLKIFFLLFLICLTSAVPAKNSVTGKRIYIQDSSYRVIAYIEPDGTVLNGSNSIMGYINSDGSILNSSYSSLGYVQSDGRILNSSYSCAGYINNDGTLLDSSYSVRAYIRNNYVLDSSNRTVLYFDTPVSKKVIAVFFMFFY